MLRSTGPRSGGDGIRETGLFPRRTSAALAAIRSLDPDAPPPDEMLDAEHPVGLNALGESTRDLGRARAELSDDAIRELSDHVINLELGRFSESGRIETAEGDVARIFGETLPREIAAQGRGEKLRLLFYAHGGLVSESNALLGAFHQLQFWRDNGVFPIFFIWETGFAETIRQIVTDAVGRMARPRDVLSWATDNIIEEVVRALQGGRIWAAMKYSAERANAAGGGAAYVAEKSAALVKEHPNTVEAHTIGHSAGAIFQANFMPNLVRQGVPVASAHYLAPAIRNDVFHAKVAPLLGRGVNSLTIFTMRKEFEKADTVTSAYRKSLLYLIHEALEDRRRTDILGLEASLRADKAARAIFGLGGSAHKGGEVVWSQSDGSRSTTHGGIRQ